MVMGTPNAYAQTGTRLQEILRPLHCTDSEIHHSYPTINILNNFILNYLLRGVCNVELNGHFVRVKFFFFPSESQEAP